jgi:hypothetical protein
MAASSCLARSALAGALALTLSACSSSADAPPAPPPAPVAAPPAAAPADELPSQTSRRYAGGRPIAWWSTRLAELRRDGPPELYRLTLERARLNGLEVVEREGGEVRVAFAKVEARP